MASNPLGPPRAPIKPLWRDPLRLAAVAGFVLFVVGVVLEKRYPLASLLIWIGLSLAITASWASLVKKRSRRP